MSIYANFKNLIERQKPEIFAFIEKHKNDCQDEDWWIYFSDCIELQFSENDDPDAVNFGKMEVWAYAKIDDEIQTTDDGLMALMMAY
jgi:hypothetical protein